MTDQKPLAARTEPPDTLMKAARQISLKNIFRRQIKALTPYYTRDELMQALGSVQTELYTDQARAELTKGYSDTGEYDD